MGKRLFYIFIILLCFSCKNAIDFRNQAIVYEERGDFEKAIYYLNKAIDKNPEYIEAYIDRGVDKAILGDFQGAIKDYTHVLEIDSFNVLAYYNRAKNYNKIDLYENALNDINKAYTQTLFNKENILFATPNWEDYEIPIHEIIFERGIVYYNLDSLDIAIQNFNSIDNINYLTEKVYYWKGLTYIKMKEIEKGCDCLQKAYERGIIDARKEIILHCNTDSFLVTNY